MAGCGRWVDESERRGLEEEGEDGEIEAGPGNGSSLGLGSDELDRLTSSY